MSWTFVQALVLFVVLRHFARGYFREPKRAEVAAFGVALTFFVTSAALAPPVAASASLAAAPVPSSAADWRNVTESCRDPLARASGKAVGSLDGALGHNGHVQSGDRFYGWSDLYLGGWAADATRVPARAVCPLVDGAFVTATYSLYGIARPDVAKALAHPSELETGFLILVPGGSIDPGRHAIGVAVQSLDGSWRMLHDPMKIDVI